MQRDLQIALVRRVLAHVERRTTDSAPAPSAVPVTAYIDAARLERERARLFRDLPLAVGHTSQLAAPGDFFTHDAAGVPLLVVRTEGGEIAAYLNVCRHRGTRVEPAERGHRSAFVCPYHAWSYGLDGRLLGVPHERGFPGLRAAPPTRAAAPALPVLADGDATTPATLAAAPALPVLADGDAATPATLAVADDAPATLAVAAAAAAAAAAAPPASTLAALADAGRGLVRVPAGVAAGFIFVRPRPAEAGEPAALDAELARWLGPLAGDLDGFGTTAAHAYAPRAVTRELSWKLALDVFLESYHLRPTHRASIYPLFFDNLGLVDPVGPHLRNVFPKRTIRELAALPESEWELRRHANVLFHLFPNTLILVQPDHAAVLHLWPAGPARATLTSYTLVPAPPATDKARGHWDANNAILYGAIDEDFAMGESIQRGLTSGANRALVFGAFEHALAHFHRQIELHTA